MTMQRGLLLAAAVVLIQVLLLVPAAASRLSNPFSVPAHRQLLAIPLSGADCAVPTGQTGCGFGSLELWSANPAPGVVPTADLYWKQVPQSAGGYTLQFTIIPRTGNCLNKVVGIVGTADGSTRLFYLPTDTVSPIVNAAAGTCWGGTTPTLNYTGNILIAAHADVGPCGSTATTCSSCQTTCMRTGSDSCVVDAFGSGCNACCPGNGRNCQGTTITTTNATLCAPLPPSPSCPVPMPSQTALTTCMGTAVSRITTCTAGQTAAQLETALAAAATAAGCSIPTGVTYKASGGISCTAGSTETVTFTATVNGGSTTCYDPVIGTFGPPPPSCPVPMPNEAALTDCVQTVVNSLTQSCTAQDAASLESALASAAAGCNIPAGVTYKASDGISCTPDSSETVTFTATVDGTSTTCYTPVDGIFPGPTSPSCSAVPLACDTTFAGTCTAGAANVNVTSFVSAACFTAAAGPPALTLTYSPGDSITCPTANQPATTVTVTVADGTSPCGTFTITASPTCPSDEPVITDADGFGVTVCSSDAEAAATFTVSNPGSAWAPVVADFTANCPGATDLESPGGIVLAGSTVTVTCVKGTGSWPATSNITLDAAGIAGPGGCTANPAPASQAFTANPAPAIDFDIAAAADICTEGNTVTTVSLTGYSVTNAAAATLAVTVGGEACTIANPPAWLTAGPELTFTCALTGPLTAGSPTLTAAATATGTGACNDETAPKSDTIALTIMQKPTVTISGNAITKRECAGEGDDTVTVGFDYTSTGATDKITVTPLFGESPCGLPVDITTSLAIGSSSVSCNIAAENMASGASITLSAVAYGAGGCQGVNSALDTNTVTIPVDSKPAATITTTTIPPTCSGNSGSIDVDFGYTSSNAASLNVTAKLGATTCGTATISSPLATGTGTVACAYTSAADPTTVTLEIVATGSGGCATFTASNSDSDALTVVPLSTVDVTAQAVAEPQCAGQNATVSVPFTWTAGSAATVTVVAKLGTSQCGTKTLTVGTSPSPNSVSCVIPAGSMLTGLSDILINATAAPAATSACAGKTASDNDLSPLTVSAMPSVTPTITPADTTFCAGKTSFDVTLGWTQTNTASLTLTPGATAGSAAANCGGAQTITNPAASGSIKVTCTFNPGVTSAVTFSLSATGTNGAKPCTSTVTAAPASITSVTGEGQICGTGGCGSMCLSGSCVAASCNTAFGFPGTGASPQFACTAAPPSASGACPATGGTPGSSCCSWADLKFSNWGWTNYIAKGSGQVCEDVYAGAAQNTISKGRNVGRVCYTYLSSGRLTYTYSLKPNVLYNDVQVYAGTNKPPAAPGQFTSKTSGLRNSNVAQPTGNFAVSGNNVWVAFHITVGDFPSAGVASLKTGQSGAGLKKPIKKKTKKTGGNRRSLL